MHGELIKSKTFWTGVSAIVGALGAFFTGQIDAATTMQTVAGALIAIFIRDGMYSK